MALSFRYLFNIGIRRNISLHIDASPRKERSHSRKMTREFVEAWKKAHSIDSVTYRDLGRNPIPHVTEAWIAAAFYFSRKAIA